MHQHRKWKQLPLTLIRPKHWVANWNCWNLPLKNIQSSILRSKAFQWHVRWGVIRGLENGLLFSQAMKRTSSKKSIHSQFKSLQRQVKLSKKHPSHLLLCHEISKSRQTQMAYQSKRKSRHETSRCILTVKLQQSFHSLRLYQGLFWAVFFKWTTNKFLELDCCHNHPNLSIILIIPACDIVNQTKQSGQANLDDEWHTLQTVKIA